MKKIKIIAIAGKSGAGKDSILSSAIKLNLLDLKEIMKQKEKIIIILPMKNLRLNF